MAQESEIHNSDCGCGECEKQGNFTYIRWATDDQGSDFSSSRTASAIVRCWQAIITSPIALDETAPSFAGLFFNKWFNVCESEEECECGCSWGIYKTPGGHPMPKNGWRYVGSTVPTTLLDNLYQNFILLQHVEAATFSTGDMIGNIQLPSFDGALISGGQTFTVQFDLIENDLYGNASFDEFIEVSFGDGGLATKFIIDNTTAPNPYQVVMTATDGFTFTADKLVIAFRKPTPDVWGNDFTQTITSIRIANIRIGEVGCYRPSSNSIGETNTGNNAGAGGVGVYDGKVGTVLNFRNINAGSPKVVVNLDAINREILIDVDDSNIQIDAGQVTDFDFEVSNNTDVAANSASRHDPATVLDSDTIDFTITGQQITAFVKLGSIGTDQLTTALQTLINKLTFISVTQNVDLDQMEIEIAALANGMVYKGSWDASTGIFPGGGLAQTGWFYYVSGAGTVDGIDFHVGDNLVAINDNASTTSYADWNHHDQTAAVQSVAGKVGVVTLIAADITDFDTEVSNNPSVAANTAKISADGSVNTHSDVNYSGATDGQVLSWNATTNQWENRNSSDTIESVTNVGTGAHIYKDILSKSIRLRSIKSPTGSLTITQAADEVQVEVNASSIDVSSFANSKKTFQTLVVSGTIFTWNYANHYNARIVFTSAGTRSLTITNVQNGDYGTILIDSTAAGATAPVLTLPAGSKVAANGVGAITLTAQGIDVWSWVYDGTNFLWTYGKQYT